MSFRNELKFQNAFCSKLVFIESLEGMLLMLAPFAPHFAEELWQFLKPGKGSVHRQPWPAYEQAIVTEHQVTLVVQVNGKLRDRLEIPVGMEKKQTKECALASEKVQSLLQGRQVRKVIVVPDKLVNIVV